MPGRVVGGARNAAREVRQLPGRLAKSWRSGRAASAEFRDASRLAAAENRAAEATSAAERRAAATEREATEAAAASETPAARQSHQTNLDEARGKRVSEMDESQFRAEMADAAEHQPRRVNPKSEHFRDYDVEVEANGHTYRRRRDGRGWCRFSDEECFVNLPSEVRRRVGIDNSFGDDLFDESLDFDPELERAASRRTRAEPRGRQAQQEALSDIRSSGETPHPTLREGLEAKRQLYMGNTPGRNSTTGQSVIARMRSETPSRIRGFGVNMEVHTVGPDGVVRWYPIDQMEMGHISPQDAVNYWNNTGRHLGPRHPQVRAWMRDPANYELEHNIVNARKGALLGQTANYLPPTVP